MYRATTRVMPVMTASGPACMAADCSSRARPALLVAGAGRGPGRRTATGGWPVGPPRPAVVRGWEPPPSPYGRRATAGWIWPRRRARRCGRRRPAGSRFAGLVAGRGVLSIELTGRASRRCARRTSRCARWSPRATGCAAGQVVAVLAAGPSHCAGGLPALGAAARRRAIWTRCPCCRPGCCAAARPGCCRSSASRLPDAAPTAARAAPAVARLRSRSVRGAADAALRPGTRCRGCRHGRRDAAAAVERRPARGQPRTPRRAMETAASVISAGSSAAPSSMRRTAASTTPWSSIAASRGCSWPSVAERLDDHGDQPAVRGADLLPRARRPARSRRSRPPPGGAGRRRAPAAGVRTPRSSPRACPARSIAASTSAAQTGKSTAHSSSTTAARERKYS